MAELEFEETSSLTEEAPALETPSMEHMSPSESDAQEPVTPLDDNVKQVFNMDHDKRLQRLKYLVEKSKVYASILGERLNQPSEASKNEEKEQESEENDKLNTVESTSNEKVHTVGNVSASTQSRSGKVRDVNSGLNRRKRQKTSKKSKNDNNSILSFVKKDELEQVVGSKRNMGVQQQLQEQANESPSSISSSSSNAILQPTKAIQQPKLISGAVMHDYQLAGMEWLISLYENGLNGILADEMGLGKTIQTIAFIAHLLEMGIPGPYLVVAPLSTIQNWINEIHRFAPKIKAVKFYGTIQEREALRKKYLSHYSRSGNFQSKSGRSKGTKQESYENVSIFVTSYETVVRDPQSFRPVPWKLLVVDEGHRIKNMNCKLIAELKRLDTANRVLLTGTPLQNNLAELWSLLNFLLPEIFSDIDIFQQWFDSSQGSLFAQGETDVAPDYNKEATNDLIKSLHSILRPFLLRRQKKDVDNFLPDKREYVIYCALSAEQSSLYQHILKRDARNYIVSKILEGSGLNVDLDRERSNLELPKKRRRKIVSYDEPDEDEFVDSEEEKDEKRTSPRKHKLQAADRSSQDIENNVRLLIKKAENQMSGKSLNNLIVQLRLTCDSPYLFYTPWKDDEPVDERLVTTSSKLSVLDQLCTALFAQGHKVLIFSQFVKMLNLIEEWAEDIKHWDVCRIDGSVSQEDRQQQIDRFNGDTSCKLFLLSTRAGGLGINLTASDSVIIFDSDWNPQVDLQAMDRVHRIGQTHPVVVYRLATANTVEQYLLKKAGSKRLLENIVIEKGKFKGLGSDGAETILDELGEEFSLIKQNHSNGCKELSQHDIEVLLDRTPEAYERARKHTEDLPEYIVDVAAGN